MSKVSVLFVCLGNICRSPTAEGVFQSIIEENGFKDLVDVDSAGTSGYHIGEPPDSRSQKAASRRGYDLSQQRSRKVEADDFDRFHYILAMDDENYRNLLSLKQRCGGGATIEKLLNFADGSQYEDVPDPYYSGHDGFELVLDLVEQGCDGLLCKIKADFNL